MASSPTGEVPQPFYSGEEGGRAVSGFKVYVYCPDCSGEDPLGCFEGRGEYIEEPNPPYAPIVFATQEEAEAAGDDAIDQTIYRYNVEPTQDEPAAGPPSAPSGSTR